MTTILALTPPERAERDTRAAQQLSAIENTTNDAEP
jgi:hypothetical protein